MKTLNQALEDIEYAEHNDILAKAARYVHSLDSAIKQAESRLVKLRDLKAEFNTTFRGGERLSSYNVEHIFSDLKYFDIMPV